MEPFVREEIPLDPKDMGWVDGELRRQVTSRAIEDATCLDYVAPAFVVVQSSGKRRVVVDFDKQAQQGHLTLKSAFRYETLKSLRHLAEKRRLGNFQRLGHSHPPGRQEILYFFHRWENF